MFNRRKPLLIVACCILVVTLFATTACGNGVNSEKTISSLTATTLPAEAIIIGEFDEAGITLTVNYSDGKADIIPVTEDMLPDEYKILLHTPGTHEIEVAYNGMRAKFTVTMRDKGKAYKRVDENGEESETGGYVLFGTYPQTAVTESELVSGLNTIAGTLPTRENSEKWTSYEYYSGYSAQNYMWYIDVSFTGETYRGVYFTDYRPNLTSNRSMEDNSAQDDNGYFADTAYWFKWEPIKWRILKETDGTAMLLSENVLDSREFYVSSNENPRTVNGETVYENNYRYSTIRAWLNDDFYNTAFTYGQQAIIKTTEVDNSARSTNPEREAMRWNDGKNDYACDNTFDKVYLLSIREVSNPDYGFKARVGERYDNARRKQNTDYARSQGNFTGTYESYAGNGSWWLRSPRYDASNKAKNVYIDGDASMENMVNNVGYGVVPVLNIVLSGKAEAEKEAYTRVETVTGDYYLFGSYPQTEVTDSGLKTELGILAGVYPTGGNSAKWTSYKYYKEGSVQDFMWYKDINYDGETYRGVFLNDYRPYDTDNYSRNNRQEGNGYYLGGTYWFKWEPIKWNIMDESNGTATLLCDMIIDSMEFHSSHEIAEFYHNGGTGYASNYALSNIRIWLNDNFYNTAFNDLQKEIIYTVEADNSERSAMPDVDSESWTDANNKTCENTFDKVWLLSVREMTRADYGFATDPYEFLAGTRMKKSTDYARSHGCWVSSGYPEANKGNSGWWLRSAHHIVENRAACVDVDGKANFDDVYDTSKGVVPALQIAL